MNNQRIVKKEIKNVVCPNFSTEREKKFHNQKETNDRMTRLLGLGEMRRRLSYSPSRKQNGLRSLNILFFLV